MLLATLLYFAIRGAPRPAELDLNALPQSHGSEIARSPHGGGAKCILPLHHFGASNMKRARVRSRSKLARDVRKVAVLAPGIAARRVGQMAVKGAAGKSPLPTLARLGTEKASVAAASASAMMFAGAALFTRTAFAFASAWSPWGGTPQQRLMRIQSVLEDAPARIAESGIAPIRKKLVANARRR